jgi:hypothetical protein
VTVLIFISLKLAEIAVGIFLPYYIGKVFFGWAEPDMLRYGTSGKVLCWLFGILIPAAMAAAVALLVRLLTLNWEWAQVISGKA